jgi:hypothetical protein
VVAGVIRPGLEESTRSILSRRKVSGDWRETPAGLSLVEVLALSPGPRAHAEPGFPVPATFSRAGRQVALTAALGPDPEAQQPGTHSSALRGQDIQEAVRAALAEDRRAQSARAGLTADLNAALGNALDKIQDDRDQIKSMRAMLAELVGSNDG